MGNVFVHDFMQDVPKEVGCDREGILLRLTTSCLTHINYYLVGLWAGPFSVVVLLHSFVLQFFCLIIVQYYKIIPTFAIFFF